MPNFAPTNAPVAKLVDAPDLGSGDFDRVGSSPIRRTLISFLVGFSFYLSYIAHRKAMYYTTYFVLGRLRGSSRR